MIFMKILQLDCYAVPELPRPGIPYITVPMGYCLTKPNFSVFRMLDTLFANGTYYCNET